MAQERDLSLQSELALGPSLDPRRPGGPLHNRLHRYQTLGTVRTIDEPGRDLAAAVPRPQGRTGHARLVLGLRQWNPRSGVEAGEQVELGLPAGQPIIPLGRHALIRRSGTEPY